MRITVLAGGVGGAKFLAGVREYARRVEAGTTGPRYRPDGAPTRITAIANTGDDLTMHGLRICPDLDSIMYTLGGANDVERGWGRAGETWRVSEQIAAYGAEPTWFSLGDLDIGSHLVRTSMLAAGTPLSEVTAFLCRRWDLGLDLLPMTDQPCETWVTLDEADIDGEPRTVHFQEWWVRLRTAGDARAFVQLGLADARPAPGVLEAIADADLVLIAPSNPVVSIDTILNVPGIRDAVRSTAAPVAGFSPIVGGKPVRGMADKCLPVLGIDVSAQGVADFYGARSGAGVLDSYLSHTGDRVTHPGLRAGERNLIMTSPAETADMIEAAVALLDPR